MAKQIEMKANGNDMTELTGSEKQIDWARSIRADALKFYVSKVNRILEIAKPEMIDTLHRMGQNTVHWLQDEITDAGWIIDNQSELTDPESLCKKSPYFRC